MLTTLLAAIAFTPAVTPAVGDKAPDFEVPSLHKGTIRLSKELKGSTVVLVVLRGYPGYQCPFCTAQVGQYMAKAGQFAEAKTKVVFVYPGPSDHLRQRAEEFIGAKDVPKNYRFGLDPDYTFVNSYGLRWDAPHETAYPSTFVIGKDGRVKWAKISRQHGDRSAADEVLKIVGEVR